MVRDPDLIAPEIADAYGVTLATVQRAWTQHPDWPAATGRRGRWKTYAADAVATWVAEHRTRPVPAAEDGGPGDLLTVAEIAEYTGLAESTIRADVTRGRIPPADDETHGVRRWRRDTIEAAMRGRRAYRRAESDV